MRLPGDNKTINTKKTALMGLLLALAIILSYIEFLIPFGFGIPGIKLGLANLCVVMLMYLWGIREALTINILRIIIVGFLFGSASSIMYSMAGAMASMLIMIIFMKMNIFSIGGVSLAGGVMHNIGQCIIAALVVSNLNVFMYLPVLVIAGALTGLVIGYIAGLLMPRLRLII